MQKLGFPSMKSLDQFKPLSGTISGSAKTFSFSSRPCSSSDSISSGNFANLKLTAEKLVKEQASVKADLEMANAKLKKSMEHIRALEEKLQIAFNENAKLKVKQKEDEKLWKGLESKFSSTKTLCDQLTETLQHLAGQVQDAEKDKEFFEGKLSASSDAIDTLNQQLNSLSLKLSSAEDTARIREKELDQLKVEQEERNNMYIEEKCRNASLITEKDAMLEKFGAIVAANKLAAESMNTQLEELQLELRLKEDQIKSSMIIQENLEKEKNELQLSNHDLDNKLASSHQEIKNLEGFVRVLAVQLIELDRQSLLFAHKFDQLNSLYDTFFKMVQQERDLAVKNSQKQYDRLYDKFLYMMSEKDSLELLNQDLNNKSFELQKAQESAMTKLSEECHLADERIQILQSEAEMLMSEKNEKEMWVSKLEEKIDVMVENSRSSEIKMEDLLLKFSTAEMENKDNVEKLEADLQKKAEEIVIFQKENEKYGESLDSLEKQVTRLHNLLEEKEQAILQYKNKEKKLEDNITEHQAFLTAAESKLVESKKQYDMMLESKHLELSRHLKELSQRNDQAINDIRKKYEVEKQEIVNMEKEKTEKVVLEIERKCDQKLKECTEESRANLVCMQEENAALIVSIQQEHNRKEMSLVAQHNEELKHTQLQAEREMREKITQIKNEHEVQMKALRCQLEDECRKLQEELNLQKSKEDRQRALLQLQWKVMSDKPQDDQEVNSKKDYSVSSIKMRDPGSGRRSQRTSVGPDNGEQDSPLPMEARTPVSKLLKEVNNVNRGSIMVMPKHHKKLTRREYEVETTNGKTITKRRKTKSTVMFGDPRKHKKRNTPKVVTPRTVMKKLKGGGGQSHPSNIGDLFSEGSLNPYADDPYAFD